MTPSEAEQIVRALAVQAASIEARRVDLGHTTGRPGPVETLKIVPGAQVERKVFCREGEDPYVLESAAVILSVDGHKIRVCAQWNRALEPAELDAFEHAVCAGAAREQAPSRFVVADLEVSHGA